MSEANLQRRRAGGLGRGLSALLGDVQHESSTGSAGSEGAPAGVTLIAVARIAPHPGQPRRHFDEAALDELAASIAARGVIQPIVVRPAGEGQFQIVAGERRWRAAQRAQLHEVPVIIRDFDEAETLEIALIENIQREDLNAIEEAEAYRRLIDEFGHSQEALAKLMHKSRSHVANLLRLLDLPRSVMAMVSDGRLSMGHARALISSPDPAALAEKVVARGLSVREVEALVRRERGGAAPSARPRGRARDHDADIAALERQIGDLLGLRVAIAHADGRGTISIDYSTLDQLDLICQRLSGEAI